MPGIAGSELAHRLKKLRPGLRVVFMSGQPEGGPAPSGVLDGHLLAKPFSDSALLEIVHRVLGRSGSSGQAGAEAV